MPSGKQRAEAKKGIKPRLCVKESTFHALCLIELGTVAVKLKGMCDALLVGHY